MVAPIVGAIARAAAGELGKKTAKKVLTGVLGEKRAKTAYQEVKVARQRAMRQEKRFKDALEFVENPMAPVSKTAKKLAREFTKDELSALKASYGNLKESLKAEKGVYSERVIQAAKKENQMAATLRTAPKVTARDRVAWERLEKSQASSKVAWSFVNKEMQRMEGKLGRKATVEDLRRIGHSQDVEEAVRNIFQERFGMTLEEAEEFDSINMGVEELYELLQYSIATGKPPSTKMYKEMVRSGWYKSPRGKKSAAAKQRRKRRK